MKDNEEQQGHENGVCLIWVPSKKKYPKLNFSSGTDTRDRDILDEINQQHKEAWRKLA